ncbi:serglycin isoform X2 [Embiotoca jacksoni]|uniref:serglycin isoform X2 n=1 Tax=Embiotoca jacksoni TaxID=100190 RepID=UPI003703F75E
MKLILLLVVACLALHRGKGAPRTAVYKFVRCNPEGDQANCVTQQSTEMPWSPDLPAKLPASAAQYLEADPEEDESPLRGEEEEKTQMINEEGESPQVFLGQEGSGGYEGSAAEGLYMGDRALAGETGSVGAIRRLFPSKSLFDEVKPAEQELKEDHLLQL